MYVLCRCRLSSKGASSDIAEGNFVASDDIAALQTHRRPAPGSHLEAWGNWKKEGQDTRCRRASYESEAAKYAAPVALRQFYITKLSRNVLG